jgi:hypothetical protein
MIEKAAGVEVSSLVPVQAAIESQKQEQEHHCQGHGQDECRRSLPNASGLLDFLALTTLAGPSEEGRLASAPAIGDCEGRSRHFHLPPPCGPERSIVVVLHLLNSTGNSQSASFGDRASRQRPARGSHVNHGLNRQN